MTNTGFIDHISLAGFSNTIDSTGEQSAVRITSFGTSRDDVQGGRFDDDISTDSGNDTVDGGGGNDTLDGGAGIDTVGFRWAAHNMTISLSGQVAADNFGTVCSIVGFENVIGSSYDDTITGTDGNNVLDGGRWGSDVINGLGGDDTVSYDSSEWSVLINLPGQITADGVNTDHLISIENATGSKFADVIIGDNGNNDLKGGEGNDTLDGGGGSNRLDGGVGNDTASYASATLPWLINIGGGLASNGPSIDTLISIENAIGSTGNDTLIGDAQANVLDGGPGGSDQINGAGGLDTVSYASSNFAVLINLAGQATSDGINTDNLTSIESATGSRFNDTILGDAGVNVLTGGPGNDALTGAGGNDQFIFRTPNEGIDSIVDFVHLADRIGLSDVGFQLGGSITASNFIASATPVATSALPTILYNTGSGALSFDIDGNGSAAPVQFASLNGAPTLTSADLFLV